MWFIKAIIIVNKKYTLLVLQRPRSDNALNSLIYGTGNYRFDNYRSNTLMYKSKQNTLCEARESKAVKCWWKTGAF